MDPKNKLWTIAVFLVPVFLASALSTTSSAYELEYDEGGNLIEDDQHEYIYNGANKLEEVWDLNGSMVAKYYYDSGGRRVKKELADGTLTFYPFPDYEETHYPNGTIERISYYYANGDRIAKKVQETGKPDETYYYHPDHLGSTNAITDGSGALEEKTKYYPFGSVLSGGVEKYGFTGQERDSETDLMYYGARYYDPGLRKFIQPDPLVQDTYDPQTLNRYAYVRNNPLKYVDPTGNSFEDSKQYCEQAYGVNWWGMLLPGNTDSMKFGMCFADIFDKNRQRMWNEDYLHNPALQKEFNDASVIDLGIGKIYLGNMMDKMREDPGGFLWTTIVEGGSMAYTAGAVGGFAGTLKGGTLTIPKVDPRSLISALKAQDWNALKEMGQMMVKAGVLEKGIENWVATYEGAKDYVTDALNSVSGYLGKAADYVFGKIEEKNELEIKKVNVKYEEEEEEEEK